MVKTSIIFEQVATSDVQNPDISLVVRPPARPPAARCPGRAPARHPCHELSLAAHAPAAAARCPWPRARLTLPPRAPPGRAPVHPPAARLPTRHHALVPGRALAQPTLARSQQSRARPQQGATPPRSPASTAPCARSATGAARHRSSVVPRVVPLLGCLTVACFAA